MILYLGNKLSKHGFTPTSVETLGPRLASLGFDVVLKSDKRNPVTRLIDMLSAVYDLRMKKPVVLIDTYSTAAFWYAWATGRLCSMLGIRYIPILRGGNLPARLDAWPRTTRRLFENSLYNIAVSGYLHAEFRKRKIPVRVIHNFIDVSLYPFRLRKEVKPKILWVRAFHEIYNPQLAVRVFRRIADAYPEATCCMVGPDKDGSMETCKKLAESFGLKINFTGRLDKTEWIRLADGYDIFLNTTDVDNTPVSVMEAMALGMPVVTTDAGGIPNLFEPGVEGIMTPVNNEDKMTEAIFSLIRNPERAASISASARAKARSWDWNVIGPQWKALLDEA